MRYLLLALCLTGLSCGAIAQKTTVPFLAQGPTIDADGKDAAWATTDWQPLNQYWLGGIPKADDFTGRYKVLTTAAGLYILAEVTDDTLMDIHPDPKTQYWDDDCLELFVDADASGGNHQYNHQALAYHLSLDGNALDLGTDSMPFLLNNYVQYKLKTVGNTTTWEVFIQLYDASFDPTKTNIPRVLKPKDRLGFALAYCDNDHSAEREHFIGSMPIPGPDTNRGWKDASLFTKLTLVAPTRKK